MDLRCLKGWGTLQLVPVVLWSTSCFVAASGCSGTVGTLKSQNIMVLWSGSKTYTVFSQTCLQTETLKKVLFCIFTIMYHRFWTHLNYFHSYRIHNGFIVNYYKVIIKCKEEKEENNNPNLGFTFGFNGKTKCVIWVGKVGLINSTRYSCLNLKQ